MRREYSSANYIESARYVFWPSKVMGIGWELEPRPIGELIILAVAGIKAYL